MPNRQPIQMSYTITDFGAKTKQSAKERASYYIIDNAALLTALVLTSSGL